MNGLERALAVLGGQRIVALTGAGLSTDSGIPDYRGPGSVPRSPMTYQQFVSGHLAQQRYWARSHVGWLRMRATIPNAGHTALARLEACAALTGLITQNVDGLHRAAGSQRVVDLHGRIADVVCLRCGEWTSRAALHERLTELNPGFASAERDAPIAPDGDAETTGQSFHLAACLVCRGALKPDVVFFGENVPKQRVERCYEMVDDAAALLVAGTSLAVQSGLRFVRRAHRRGIPIVIVNRGPTRGDDLADVRVDAGCSATLTELAVVLGAPEGLTSQGAAAHGARPQAGAWVATAPRIGR